MSFSIPKKLEPLGFEKIGDIDRIEDGDLIVIPSEEDAKSLRVSADTLRKWGLSFSSEGNVRSGCARYEAVRRLFGSSRWPGYKSGDARSHAVVVSGASHDRNARRGNDDGTKFTFVNPNSMTECTTIVEKPAYPLMALTALPFDPLYPLCGVDDDYPETLGIKSDRRAYDLLTSFLGKDAFPTIAATGRSDSGASIDLPYTVAVLSTLFCDNSDYAGVLGKKRIVELSPSYMGYDRRPLRASGIVMTGPVKTDKDRNDHCNTYFHHDSYQARTHEIVMTRKFVDNIVRRGACVYRAPSVFELASKVMACAVAREMRNRYASAVASLERLATGLSAELPAMSAILKRYEQACGEFSVDADVLSEVRNMFGEVR